MTYALGIDVGTTFTAAAMWRDGRAETVPLGDRANTIPSVLFLRDDGQWLVGEPAERRALTEPSRVAREFKRRVGDSVPVLLGSAAVTTQELTAQLIGWVLRRITEREGEPPECVALTCPANWGSYRQETMTRAAEAAGLPGVRLLAEPAAAAIHYASRERLPPDGLVGVYDLGGGTFDAAVLRKIGEGFELVGRPAGDDGLGGIDFDQMILDYVTEILGPRWTGLDLTDPAVLGAMAQVRANVVSAKEALSSDLEVGISVILPGVTRAVRLTRAEFSERIRPSLESTIETFGQAIASARITPAELHAVLLVGGSSRIPLVSQLVAGMIGVPVAVDAHPKFAVCLGAAIDAARGIEHAPARHAFLRTFRFVDRVQRPASEPPTPPVAPAPEVPPAPPVAEPASNGRPPGDEPTPVDPRALADQHIADGPQREHGQQPSDQPQPVRDEKLPDGEHPSPEDEQPVADERPAGDAEPVEAAPFAEEPKPTEVEQPAGALPTVDEGQPVEQQPAEGPPPLQDAKPGEHGKPEHPAAVLLAAPEASAPVAAAEHDTGVEELPRQAAMVVMTAPEPAGAPAAAAEMTATPDATAMPGTRPLEAPKRGEEQASSEGVKDVGQAARRWSVLLVAASVVAVVLIGGAVLAAGPWDRGARALGGTGVTTTLAPPTSSGGPASSTLPGPPGTRVLLREDFSDTSNRWTGGEDARGRVTYENGTFNFHVVKARSAILSEPTAVRIRDARVLLEVDARWVSGAADAGYGVYCRLNRQGTSYYSVYIAHDGAYMITKLLDGKWLANPLAYGRDAAIKRDQVNRLQAVCSGGETGEPVTLSLTVNGKLVSRVDDSSDPLPAGTAGLLVAPIDNVPVDVAFDHFAAYGL